MIKKLSVLLILFVLLFSTSLFAYTITVGEDVIDVGGLDTHISSMNIHPPNADKELNQLNIVSGGYYTKLAVSKYDFGNKSLIVKTNTLGIYAFDFSNLLPLNFTPEYYLIKVGNSQDFMHHFYKNAPEFTYAVFDLSRFTINSISHFSAVGTSVPVPEPSTLLLFGAGIAGLALYRRKRS